MVLDAAAEVSDLLDGGADWVGTQDVPFEGRSWTDSGRTLSSIERPTTRSFAATTQASPDARRTTASSLSTDSTVPVNKLVVPMKSATNRVVGRS